MGAKAGKTKSKKSKTAAGAGSGQPGRLRRLVTKRRVIAAVLLVAVAAGSLAAYTQYRQADQVFIKNSGGSTYPYAIPNSQTRHFDEGFFAFDLPADWKLLTHDDTGPYNRYSFQATLKNYDNRYLDIYADRLPLTLAVNKEVSVQAAGANLSHGQVSDKCTTFMGTAAPGPGGAKPLAVPAKWEGVDFLCDNDNINRNVVGSGAPGTPNKVVLTGPASGAHSFFFVYTDNNYNPQYSIFYDTLESFAAK